MVWLVLNSSVDYYMLIFVIQMIAIPSALTREREGRMDSNMSSVS